MSEQFEQLLKDHHIPMMLYGTAWKEEKTAELTELALKAGFIGIDTANQRKHYFEQAVGEGIQSYLQQSQKKRVELFIQTKFTYERGQDHRLPYNPKDSLSHQVGQSFSSSLTHLQTDYLDSFILHGPYYNKGISEQDLETWKAMEVLVNRGEVRFLGVSNISLQQLEILYEKAQIKPKFVQNRCFAIQAWDKEIRRFCENKGLIYQGFSLLTANQQYLFNSRLMKILQKKYNKTIPQIVFRFAQNAGILSLTGTTDKVHMRQDLAIDDFSLTEKELLEVEHIAMSER